MKNLHLFMPQCFGFDETLRWDWENPSFKNIDVCFFPESSLTTRIMFGMDEKLIRNRDPKDLSSIYNIHVILGMGMVL